MDNIFEHASSNWVKYSNYDLVQADDNTLYVMPADNAKVNIFNPLKNSEQIVIDALNVGLTCMSEKSTDDDIVSAIFGFVSEYGCSDL